MAQPLPTTTESGRPLTKFELKSARQSRLSLIERAMEVREREWAAEDKSRAKRERGRIAEQKYYAAHQEKRAADQKEYARQ